MSLLDLITLHQVRYSTTEFGFAVTYGEDAFNFYVAGKSSFEDPPEDPAPGQISHEFFGFTQADEVPNTFVEVMMFHEIREGEYRSRFGISEEEAHQRAVNDEILYVLKFFVPERQQKYFKWVQEYRKVSAKPAQAPVSSPPPAAARFEVPKFYADWREFTPVDVTLKEAFDNAQLLIAGRPVRAEDVQTIVDLLDREHEDFPVMFMPTVLAAAIQGSTGGRPEFALPRAYATHLAQNNPHHHRGAYEAAIRNDISALLKPEKPYTAHIYFKQNAKLALLQLDIEPGTLK